VDSPCTTFYWSNDGEGDRDTPPTDAVQLSVSEGLFNVLLRDTTLNGMTQTLDASVFSGTDRYLRVWFSTSGGGPFNQLTPDTRIGAVPYALQAEEAKSAASAPWSGITGAPDFREKYAQVVIVAKSGGDYTSVQDAINSITDASASNPYLVWVAPGVYSETVTMKPYVHLQGAGQEATVIISTASTTIWLPNVATLKLASNTSLRDLTVGNSGAGMYNVALLATDGTTQTLVADVTAKAQGGGSYNYGVFLTGSGTGVTLQHVTALGENGNGNYGLYNYEGPTAALRGGSFTGRGGTDAWGIYNYGSGTTLEAESVTALGENGSSTNRGLGNYEGPTAALRGGSFTGRGGTDAWGIYNIVSIVSGTTLEAEGVTALGESGSSKNYGLYNDGGAAATADSSQFTGASNALYQTGGTVSLGVSQLDGGATRTGGTLTCFQVYDGNYAAYTCP
jgi:hypothetical protein